MEKYQVNQRLVFAINAAAKAEKKTITIKGALKPSGIRQHPRKFMGMLGGSTSIIMTSLGISFQYEENNYMVE